VPRGKVSDFQGDPGQGKSLLCVDIASRISAGGKFPDGSQAEAGNVIIVSAEDDVGDTLRPRIETAGADLKRVRLITVRNRLPTLPDDLPGLRAIIDRDKAVLICFDPLDAFISDKIDSHKNQSIRRLIARLATLAAETGIAVLVIRHLNKDSKTSNPMYRGGGSIGLNAAARSVFVIGATAEDPDLHVLAWVKGNLGKNRPLSAIELLSARLAAK
jgi:RecA-family ATPase